MGAETLLSVAHSLLSTENDYFNIYIDGLDDQVFSLQAEQLQDVVQTISSLLSKASTRPLGIRLMNKYLDQCSNEVFARTGNLWTSLVLKSCQGQNGNAPAYEALAKMALKSIQTPELTKTFATTHLAKVYETLMNTDASCVVPALRCVENCLRLYPSASGPSKRGLEKFLSRFHDSTDTDIVSYTGKCWHLLQQVSGGEAHSSNHKTLWKNYQTQLVGSIHEVFDDMFANCADMWDGNVVRERLACLEKLVLSPEPIPKAAQLYVRCHNLIQYLMAALKEPFPVEKPLMPRKLLEVINRGLSVTCNMLQQNAISDNIALALLLPKVHLDLLQLLDAVIIVLRGHLLPHYNLILGILMDVMRSTVADDEYPSNQKRFRQLRIKVYDSIALWCKVNNAGSRCETISEHLIQEIHNDITPKSNELTLQVTKVVSKHTSKKMKRQLQKAQNERSKIAQFSFRSGRSLEASQNDQRNQMLCTSALKCLQEILFSGANFIKPTKIKLIQTTLIQICANLYELPLESSYLFGNSQCRLELYNSLYAVLTTPHHLSPPPADIILAILNTARYRDRNMKVRNHCAWILQNLEKITHPQKESLIFPIDAKEIRNAFIMLGQEKLLLGSENGHYENGLNNEESEDEVESAPEGNSEPEENGQLGSKIDKPDGTNGDINRENNLDDLAGEANSREGVNNYDTINKDNPQNAVDSPQTVSDSDDNSSEPPDATVEISSGDESKPMTLRVDEDSDQDEVEIINLEPPSKKSRIDEETLKNNVVEPTNDEEETKNEEVESKISEKEATNYEVEPKNREEENKKHKEESDKQEEESKIEQMPEKITQSRVEVTADDIIMDLDEDALVDDIASQFVDDLA